LKVVIMLVRVLGLIAIVLGTMLWATALKPLAAIHILVGFIVAGLVFTLALVAFSRGALIPAVLGLLLSVLLPVAGFMQLPLRFQVLGAIQVLHIVIALSVIGLAERLYAAIRSPQ
jgi:hypothetical protein